MKKMMMLGIVLVTMLASLGGCYLGYEDRGRGGRYERGEGHDHDHDRDRDHDKGGGHSERR